MGRGARPRRRLPLPPPPRPLVLVPFLAAGVIGTGLLYRAATQGRLGDFVGGAVLFALGMWFTGRPFVLAATLRHERRARARPAPSPPDGS